MTDLNPRLPTRPLQWPDVVYDLQDVLIDQLDMTLYIVGGAVRDAWQHKPLKDLDLATPGNATKIARKIANLLDGDVFVMDAERDVARVFLEAKATPYHPGGSFIVDVAHFRGDDLLADLRDRDFTLNAIAVDLLGDLNQIIDPLNGEQDLSNRIIRQCGPGSISNDPLRGLRALRQSAQLNARIEPETLKAVRTADLSPVSTERVRDELFKLLATDGPTKPLRLTGALGLLDTIIPEIATMKATSSDIAGVNTVWELALRSVEKMYGILNTISTKRTDTTAARFELGMIVMAMDRHRQALQAHIGVRWPNERLHTAVLTLAAMLAPGVTGTSAGERVAALRLSNDEKKRVARMVNARSAVLNLPRPASDLDLHRYWYPLSVVGLDAILVALAVYLAEHNTDLDQDAWVIVLDQVGVLLDAYFNRYEQVVVPLPLLDGNDLMDALNIAPGKQVGELLVAIREGQVTGEVITVDDAITLARAQLGR